ncbi:MAG TPA: lysozyme [bacterium]|nr:lysozyme [bacterium]
MKKIREISQAGIELIKVLEGCRRYVYDDEGGYPTIGIGHLLTRTENMTGKLYINGESVYYHQGLTDQQCVALLIQDLAVPVNTVNEAVMVPLNQNQFDALVSFVFNIGCGNFRKSTLLRVLNSGNYEKVPEQMRLWAYVKENVSKGLQKRREEEIKLWRTPSKDESAGMDSLLPIDFIDPPEPRVPWYKWVLQLFKR